MISPTNQTNQTNQIDQIDQIEKNVEAGHPGLSPAIKNAFGAVTGAAEQAAIYALEKLSSFLGTDLTNKDSVNEKLDEIKQIVSDPEIRQKLMLIAVAAKPALQKFTEEIVEAVTKSADKIGQGAVKVILNTLEEIPGVGVLIGTARSADTIAQTFQSVGNTFAEVTMSASDAINETKQNMVNIMNTKIPSYKMPEVPNMSSIPTMSSYKMPEAPKSLRELHSAMKGGQRRLTQKKSRILKKIRKSIKKFHDTTYIPNLYLRKRSRKNKRFML
jgi:hypothetical protein